jgi:hypothetical protein
MKRLRLRRSRTALVGVFFGFTALPLLAATVIAEVPASVDSYGSSAFASGIHVIAGSNNDPNFSHGAIGNRYPLAQAGQDISPASAASASINDYGPLVSTVLGNACNAPPPSPLPQPSPPPSPDYCLEPIRAALPYANAQYPHPPGVGDASTNGPNGSNIGTASAHAEELAARADGAYAGSPTSAPAAAITNATAHSETVVAKDGSITVKTHSHLGSACFGSCNLSNWLVVTNTDVQTIVTAVNGKPVPEAVVAPGLVQFCSAPGNCQVVQVSSNGVTVGGIPAPTPPPPPPGAPVTVPGVPSNVPVPGLGGSAQSPFFKIRTIDPKKVVTGSTGSVDAFGLDVEVMQPGNQEAGIPDAQVEFIIGEGHAEGFSLASLGLGGGSLDLGNGADFGPGVSGIVSEIAGSNPEGSSANVSLPKIRHTKTGNAGGLALAGALRPPFILWFYAWEASALAAAAAMVWARRQHLRELAEQAALEP